MAKADNSPRHPSWWNDSHSSAWNLVREAFRQSFHSGESQPAEESESDPKRKRFDEVEHALRFGYSARRQFEEDWDPSLEARLENDWDTLHEDRPVEGGSHVWDDVRPFVHRGWLGP